MQAPEHTDRSILLRNRVQRPRPKLAPPTHRNYIQKRSRKQRELACKRKKRRWEMPFALTGHSADTTTPPERPKPAARPAQRGHSTAWAPTRIDLAREITAPDPRHTDDVLSYGGFNLRNRYRSSGRSSGEDSH